MKKWVIVSLIGLAGCMRQEDIYPPVHRKELELSHLHETIWVTFVGNGQKLSTESQQELMQLLTMPARCKQSIHAFLPPAETPLARVRLKTIKDFLKTKGVHHFFVQGKSEAKPCGGASLPVEILIYRVTPPTCPDWHVPLGRADQSITPSNFGCASALNFYQSIQDPALLFKGQRIHETDSPRQTVMVQDFQSRKKLEITADKLEKQD